MARTSQPDRRIKPLARLAGHHSPRIAGFALALIVASGGPALSDEIDDLPITTIFVTSGGYWEDADQAAAQPAEQAPDSAPTAPAPKPATGADATTPTAPPASDTASTGDTGQVPHGYYKLVALRQADRTANVFLQQIEVTPDGALKMIASTPLDELAALKPYVTDIRPEDSTGVTKQPGFFATVFLKTDPAAQDPESWTVIVDEFGAVQVERATN